MVMVIRNTKQLQNILCFVLFCFVWSRYPGVWISLLKKNKKLELRNIHYTTKLNRRNIAFCKKNNNWFVQLESNISFLFVVVVVVIVVRNLSFRILWFTTSSFVIEVNSRGYLYFVTQNKNKNRQGIDWVRLVKRKRVIMSQV